jgi:hypothetical protein
VEEWHGLMYEREMKVGDVKTMKNLTVIKEKLTKGID